MPRLGILSSLPLSGLVANAVPGAPTIGTATVASATSATVTYTAPTSAGGSPITLYTATSSPDGITGTLAQAGSGTITVTGLTNNTAYTFTVTATNASGTGPASASSNSVTPITVAGQQVYEGIAAPGSSSSMFTWICPPGVTSVSVVAVGSGGNGGPAYFQTAAIGSAQTATGSAGGGGLGWQNNIPVTPGNSYTVAAGNRNSTGPFLSGQESGAESYFKDASTVRGGGGQGWITRTGGGFVGGGGGNGRVLFPVPKATNALDSTVPSELWPCPGPCLGDGSSCNCSIGYTLLVGGDAPVDSRRLGSRWLSFLSWGHDSSLE